MKPKQKKAKIRYAKAWGYYTDTYIAGFSVPKERGAYLDPVFIIPASIAKKMIKKCGGWV